jgi:hypothetical protein
VVLIKQIDENLPAILGLVIAGIWLLYTSLLVTEKKDIIKIVAKWFSVRKVILPSLAIFVMPFLFTYLYQQFLLINSSTGEFKSFVATINTVIGAVLGFFISELRQWLDEGKQAKRVRSMLKLEIDQNITLLRGTCEHWNKANQVYKTTQRVYNLCQSLRAVPLPQWLCRVWNSQVSLLVIACNEEENRQIDNLYSQMNQITNITNQLSVLISDLLSLDVPESYESPLDLDSEAKQKYDQDKPKQRRILSQISELLRNRQTIANNIIDIGNPLQNDI